MRIRFNPVPSREIVTAPAAFFANPSEDPNGVLSSGLVHPALAKKIETLLFACRERGLKVLVWEGYRDPHRQNRLYASGGVTRARAFGSWHNYGLAADVLFRNPDGSPSWDANHDWKEMGRLGKTLGLTWGGDFKSIKDLGHFEWHPGLNLERARGVSRRGCFRDAWELVRDI